MQDEKWFHIGDLYSVSSGILVAPDFLPANPDGELEELRESRMDGVRNVINHVTKNNSSTAGMIDAADAVTDYLLKQLPFLAQIEFKEIPDDFTVEESNLAVDSWVNAAAEKHGMWHKVGSLDSHSTRSDIQIAQSIKSFIDMTLINQNVDTNETEIKKYKSELTENGDVALNVQQQVGPHKLNMN